MVLSEIMDQSYDQKTEAIKLKFSSLATAEERYHMLMEMGRRLPPLPQELKTPDRVVKGCQSTLYLHSFLKEGKLFFEASSEALISAGLAALLIAVYSGETPETILKCPPHFISELGIPASLSPSRSNGLAHIHLRMKQDALNFLIAK